MKTLLISLVLVYIFYLGFSEGFLLGHKFVDGCNPNPCEHKGNCTLDARNKTAFTCKCPEGYHGRKCELKTGCYKKPCKKGVCTNNKINPSNYTCECEQGYVGPDCDIADACLKKHPCEHGVCRLDKKFKPYCTCPPGYGSKKCDKLNCTVIEFKGKQFTKKASKVYIDQAVEKRFEALDELAKLCHVKINPLKSFTFHTNPNKTNKYDPFDKTNPNFYIGHALKFELYHVDDHKTEKLLCNEICLTKYPIPLQPAKCFIDGLKAIQFHWTLMDPTVVSTDFHVANILEYNWLREHHQVGCKKEIKH